MGKITIKNKEFGIYNEGTTAAQVNKVGIKLRLPQRIAKVKLRIKRLKQIGIVLNDAIRK